MAVKTLSKVGDGEQLSMLKNVIEQNEMKRSLALKAAVGILEENL